MKSALLLFAATLFSFLPAVAQAQVANIKVVTDANPDYSDMESMVHSITANWKTDPEKMWALFYWDHIGRRQTGSAYHQGFEVTDPIRQFNDFGYTHFSAIAGIKCSEWNYMGYPCRLTGMYPEVWYDGQYHLYDNSYGLIYSLPDGKTIAGAMDLSKTMAGPETGGKEVPNYLVLYHALTGTSPRGYAEADDHALEELVGNFGRDVQPTYQQQRGHRYILNLRPGEIYTRYYHRQDESSGHAMILDNEQSEYKADPAAFVHMGLNAMDMPADLESNVPGFHVRGSGERTFTPILDAAHLAGATYSVANVQALSPGLQAAAIGQPAEAVFKVEGSNIITSFKLRALATVASADDAVAISISTDQGAHWKELWKTTKPGDNAADTQFITDVNGIYDFLIKVTLSPKSKPEDAQLKFIGFNTWTQINSKTQPQLNLGANTVYVGVGDASNSIVLEPELQRGRYKANLFEEKNIRVAPEHWSRFPVLFAQEPREASYLVFKLDAPTDITALTYGGRFSLDEGKAPLTLLHSFDGGKTWKEDHTIDPAADNIRLRNDCIHYERVSDVPPGTRSVLFKYQMNLGGGDMAFNRNAIYALRMEVDHKLADPTPMPLEVTFRWRERQKDRTLVPRSHTQLVEKLPATYRIDVGGVDHPIVDSLTISLKGTRGDPAYGYSDGVDPGGEKWVGTWETVGKDLALGKPYTYSVPSGDNWGAGDPKMTRLTDGVVGPCSTNNAYGNGPIWGPDTHPEITLDLGQAEKCAAFRIHILGYPWWDAIRGDIKDQVEVLTSVDGKTFQSAGHFNFKLFRKDIPLNFMLPGNESLPAYNFVLPLAQPVEARYVKYKLSPHRLMGVSEIQVLDSYSATPFDLKIALPDPSTNGKPSPKADVSANAKQWTPDELPTAADEAVPTGNRAPRGPRPRRQR